MTLVIGIDTGTHVRNFNRIDHSIDNASILGFQSSSLKQARPCVGSFKRGGHINLEIWSRCIGDFKRHSRLSSPVAFTHISTSRADNTVHLVLQFHAIPGEVLETSIATISSGRVVDAIDDVPLHTDMIFRRQPSPVIIATIVKSGNGNLDILFGSIRQVAVVNLVTGRPVRKCIRANSQSHHHRQNNSKKLLHNISSLHF